MRVSKLDGVLDLLKCMLAQRDMINYEENIPQALSASILKELSVYRKLVF